MLFRPARAYDWAYDVLTEADRAEVPQGHAPPHQRRLGERRGATRRRPPQPALQQPRQPHLAQDRRGGHRLPGRNPRGRNVARLRREQVLRLLPGVVRRRRRLARRRELLGRVHEQGRLVAAGRASPPWGSTASRSRSSRQVGDYPLYIAPPGSPNMGFGDLSFRPPSAGWGGFMEYFIRAGRAAEPDGDRTPAIGAGGPSSGR